MREKCPHGISHPVSSATAFRIGVPVPIPAPRQRVILDSRECPDCLRAQIGEANTILNEVFERRTSTVDANVLRLWADYVVRYNP